MNIIKPQQINRILAVTDRLGIHREGVIIPLDLVPGGRVGVDGRRRLEILGSDVDFDAWLESLPRAIEALDLAGVKRV